MEGRTKVLLIDDEEDVCFFLKGNLEHTGDFDVLTTTSGKEGIEFARGEKPDIILLDLNMPDMSGDEVAQILSDGSDTKTIPIVFITALITKGEVGDDSITNIGGYNYVAKPVATKELVAVIRRILN
jgi:DNA-binding response OmpR family regulator